MDEGVGAEGGAKKLKGVEDRKLVGELHPRPVEVVLDERVEEFEVPQVDVGGFMALSLKIGEGVPNFLDKFFEAGFQFGDEFLPQFFDVLLLCGLDGDGGCPGGTEDRADHLEERLEDEAGETVLVAGGGLSGRGGTLGSKASMANLGMVGSW
jgi:hypothetical protein